MNEFNEKSKSYKQPPPPHLPMQAYTEWVWKTVTTMDPDMIRMQKRIQGQPMERFVLKRA